jgi:hypothetical protein
MTLIILISIIVVMLAILTTLLGIKLFKSKPFVNLNKLNLQRKETK